MNINNQNSIYTFALIEPVKLIFKIAGTTLAVTKSNRHKTKNTNPNQTSEVTKKIK
jgi:hypothetical protein